jgi:hypothetical protein
MGEKFIIAQPSINLINQSIRQFQERWPNIAVRAIHSETTNNVVRAISPSYSPYQPAILTLRTGNRSCQRSAAAGWTAFQTVSMRR